MFIARKTEVKKEEEFILCMLEAFDAADLDGNGSIDFSEFIRNEWQVNSISFYALIHAIILVRGDSLIFH